MSLIVPIVEGHGEVEALPVLLRRLAGDAGRFDLEINQPIRSRAGEFLAFGEEFRRHLELAAKKARSRAGSLILILYDSEDACPARLGPTILDRCVRVVPDQSLLVSLAHREFETWFLAAIGSLAGRHGVHADAVAPINPEARRDAKGWLNEFMPRDRPYKETLHQKKFAAAFSVEEAEKVPSFARLRQKLAAYLAASKGGA